MQRSDTWLPSNRQRRWRTTPFKGLRRARPLGIRHPSPRPVFAMPTLVTSDFNIVLAVLGAFVLLFGLVSVRVLLPRSRAASADISHCTYSTVLRQGGKDLARAPHCQCTTADCPAPQRLYLSEARVSHHIPKPAAAPADFVARLQLSPSASASHSARRPPISSARPAMRRAPSPSWRPSLWPSRGWCSACSWCWPACSCPRSTC